MIAPEPPQSCKIYTPKPLASAMVAAICRNDCQRWLEPSCGTGAFLEALHESGVPNKKIVGVDLDIQAAEADQFAVVSRGIDFLEWSRTRSNRFDCVVGNPPFVAIRRFPETLRQVASTTEDFNGRMVGDRSNTWYPFLVRSIKSLRDGGSLAFVLPAACEYADYASSGRMVLAKMFDRVDVIRSRRPLFDEVAEGVVVLIAQGKGGTLELFRRHEVKDLDDMIRRIYRLTEFKARSCPNGSRCRDLRQTVPCSQVVDIRIGGVTGDAKYFLLSESQRVTHKLPKSALLPVVSRSRHILHGVHNRSHWQSLCSADEKVWLFLPSGQALKNRAVRRYLDLNEDAGGCHRQRFKIRGRDPWFVTPLPAAADAFLTGMSSTGLWMCMNEYPSMSATNTLYVASFREASSRAERYAWALSILTSNVQKQVSRAKRIYADGLSKLEPGQIADLELPVPPAIPNAVSAYRKVSSAFLRGDQREAGKIADKLVLG